MKKNLTEIFDEADVKELEVLLTGDMADKLDDATLRSIKEEVFLRTDFKKAAGKKKVVIKNWKAFVAAAAVCIVLLAGVGGGVAHAAETKEYNNAVNFFNNYGLSTEGLSRGEIKAIYKDITTKAFEHSKTAEIIAMSITDSQVEGYEIMQNIVSPEDVEDLWNYKNYADTYTKEGYIIHDEYKFDEKFGYDVFDKCIFEKYEDNELVWQVSFEEFFVNGYKEVQAGVFVYGMTPFSSDNEYAWIALLDNKGNVRWKTMLFNGFGTEYVADVFENDDGTYAVFSRGDLEYFCLNTVNADGNIVDFNKSKAGVYGIWNMTRLGDGYIAQLGNSSLDEREKIVKVDKDGNILDSFIYESEESSYHIVDMIEYYGKVYFSAYAVPASAKYEIEPIIDYIYDGSNGEISEEELTTRVRDNYTAMLLVCDADSGIPEEFYQVKGSLGGSLEFGSEGELVWDVESIATTFYSPATSSFTIGGTNHVFMYTFNSSGTLVSMEKTKESTMFRR